MDTTMNNTSPQSQSDLPWDSLVDTFPFLTTQAYQTLSIQLQFFRNMSTANLPIPEDIAAKERLKTILDKAKLVNELMSSLTHSSELLIELKNLEFDEMIDARREEVSSMIDEAGENMEKVINMQAKEESEKVPGQQGAEPGVAEVQNQQKPPEQQIPIDQMLGELGLEVPRPQESQVPLVQPTAPQQIPGLHQASALPTGHQGYNPAPVHNQAPVLGQVPAHPLPETVPIPRRDSVYTETSTTSSDDSKILRMVDKAMEKQKQKERAAKRMAKMKRERERGDFCKRCGRC
jgi:hypothetical protein